VRRAAAPHPLTMEYECRASTHRTHDIARLRKSLQKMMTTFLRFLASHAREQYESRTPQPESALKEFFETADIEAWKTAMIAFGNTITTAASTVLIPAVRSGRQGICISTVHLALLALTGYQHDISLLRADCEKTIAINKDFLRLRNLVTDPQKKKKPTFCDYIKLLERSGLEDIKETKDMTARQIVDLIVSADISKVVDNTYQTITRVQQFPHPPGPTISTSTGSNNFHIHRVQQFLHKVQRFYNPP